MFSRKPNPRVEELDTEISRVLAIMAERIVEPDSEEYASAAEQFAKLCDERNKLTSNRVSKDQLLLVGSNVIIAGIVVFHERSAVITTKVTSFLGKTTR